MLLLPQNGYIINNMKNWSDYLSQDGIIQQKDGDQGDSLNREAFYTYGWHVLNDPAKHTFEWCSKALQPTPGVYIRGNSAGWWNNPLNLSRDQQDPFMIAIGALGTVDQLNALVLAQLKRFGLYNNSYPDWVKPGDPSYINKLSDIPSPTSLAAVIRAYRMLGLYWTLLLYPIVLLCDIYMLLGSLVDIYKSHDPKQAGEINVLMYYMQAYQSMPTPLSYLARNLYSQFRQKANCPDMSVSNIQSLLDGYFGVDPMAPPINELWVPIVEQYFVSNRWKLWS